MLSDLFFQAVFLVIYCTLFVFAHYASGSTGQTAVQKGVNLFTTAAINQIYNQEGTSNDGGDNSITPTDFYSPFLVATDDVIVALAGVSCTANCEKKVVVLARHIKTESDWITKISENNWKKQFAVKEDWTKKESLKFLLAAAQNQKIYLLLVNESSQDAASGLNWNCKFFTGTVTDGTSAQTQFKWNIETPSENNCVAKLKAKVNQDLLEEIPSNGFVLLKEKGNAMFVLQFDKPAKKKTFVFIEFAAAEPTVNLATLEAEGDCLFKLFSWKTKIMLAKYCGDKSSILELQDKGGDKGWENTKEPISRLVHHFKDKNNFTAASITNNNVLLFTQQQKKTVGSAQKSNCIDLWMTDGSRLHNVGPIASSETDEVTSAGLLYTKKNHLFLLHRQAKEGQEPKSIILTHLKEQIGKINTKLEQWKNNDNNVQQLYKDIATRENLFLTDGLVGFLSGIKKERVQEWTNVYHSFDATINERGAEKLKNESGFKFSGAGAGAQWPVTKTENKDQPYNFIDTGFTLVATVTVGNGTNSDYISILGVGLANNPKKSVGLWCTKNGKWAVKVVDGQTNIPSSDINCTRNEKYYVAVILNNKNNNDKIFIYVDGEQIPKSDSEAIDIRPADSIDHFYFGVDKETESEKTDVTITDVLLYNRPFEKEKIIQLKPKKEKKLEPEQKREGDTGNLPTPDESTIQTENSSPGTSATPTTTEKDGAEIKLCLFSMNSVTVLSLLLFVGFSLLGCYV